MKNSFLKPALFVLIVFFISCTRAFAQSVFEAFDVKEPLTSKVVLQTVLPQGASYDLKSNFSDNRINPLYFDFFAENGDEKFYYSSPEIFVTTLQKRTLTAFKSNFFKDYPEKDFVNAENSVLKLFPKDAENIKKIREISFSSDIKEYLNADWYKYLETTGYKSDAYSSETFLENAENRPFVAIYSYSLNGKPFEKSVFTNIATADFDFVYTTLSNTADKEIKKLVRIDGIFSCDYPAGNHDKAFEDFVVFVANTKIPFRAQSALEMVTKQKYMNEKLTDEEKIKGIPSELFVRFYENELPFTSEENSEISGNVFLINSFQKLSNYRYGSKIKLFQKNIFVPEEYSYVYLKKGKIFSLSENKIKKAGKRLRKK